MRTVTFNWAAICIFEWSSCFPIVPGGRCLSQLTLQLWDWLEQSYWPVSACMPLNLQTLTGHPLYFSTMLFLEPTADFHILGHYQINRSIFLFYLQDWFGEGLREYQHAWQDCLVTYSCITKRLCSGLKNWHSSLNFIFKFRSEAKLSFQIYITNVNKRMLEWQLACVFLIILTRDCSFSLTKVCIGLQPY